MSSPSRRRPPTAAVVVALLIVYIVWGSTYLGIAVMIETMPPLTAAGIRYALAGILLLGGLVVAARIRGATAERPTRAQWGAALVTGCFLLLGGNGGVVLGELLIPSGVAAVLIATMPIWMALFDALVSRRWPSRLVVGGLIAGVVGVGIMLAPMEGIGKLDPIGVAFVLGAAVSWAIGSIYSRHAPRPHSGFLASGMSMLGGGLALVVVGVLAGELATADIGAISTRSWVAFVYLVLIGSVVAFTAYVWLLGNVSVSTVATYAYVNPLVAVALGAVILSEPITPRTLIAGVIIIGAVVAMVSGRPRDAEEPGPSPDVVPLEPRKT